MLLPSRASDIPPRLLRCEMAHYFGGLQNFRAFRVELGAGPADGNRADMTYHQRTSYGFEDLELGMEASFAKTVTEADILSFAEVTGDRNPVHLDEGYAGKTMFKGRIAHGMLTAGFISAVFGMELPGPGAIYVSQTLNFRAPVRIGDHAIAKVKVVELMAAKRRARFDCTCLVGDKVVLEGEAILMVPKKG
jgi:3-hydroxybutyryl-CoA dehydratase